jgi:hypothetical protein
MTIGPPGVPESIFPFTANCKGLNEKRIVNTRMALGLLINHLSFYSPGLKVMTL